MSSIQRILVGVAADDPSIQALRRALSLAERLGAELEVIHVSHNESPSADLIARVHAELQSTPYAELPLNLRRGSPEGVLIARAEEWGAGLVVVGPHRKEVFRFGSTARTLLNECHVPVLVQRGNQIPIVGAVVGSDLGTGTSETFRFTRDLASALNVPVDVVHCFAGPDFAYLAHPTLGEAAVMPTYTVDHQREKARRRLETKVEEFDWKGIQVCSTLVEEDPVQFFAKQTDGWSVVIGRHGKQGLIGSLFATNEHLRERAACPVFVVPHA